MMLEPTVPQSTRDRAAADLARITLLCQLVNGQHALRAQGEGPLSREIDGILAQIDALLQRGLVILNQRPRSNQP